MKGSHGPEPQLTGKESTPDHRSVTSPDNKYPGFIRLNQ